MAPISCMTNQIIPTYSRPIVLPIRDDNNIQLRHSASINSTPFVLIACQMVITRRKLSVFAVYRY